MTLFSSMVIEAFKYLTKIQSEFVNTEIHPMLQQNRKRSAETAQILSIQEAIPKQQKLRQNVENNLESIDYPTPGDSGNDLVAIKFETPCDSSYTKTEEKQTSEDLEMLRDDENIEIIDINLDKTAEQQGLNQFNENPEPTDKKIKIPAPPDREILNSLAIQRAGTLEDPYLVYVAPGVRKLSVNYYFLIGGELFYATKRHSMRFTDKFGPERHKITVQCSKSAEFLNN